MSVKCYIKLIKNNKKEIAVIILSIISIFIILQFNWMYDHNNYSSMFLRLITTIIISVFISVVYLYFVINLLNKITDLNRNELINKMKKVHLPIYLLYLYFFHLKIINKNLPIIVIILIMIKSFDIIKFIPIKNYLINFKNNRNFIIICTWLFSFVIIVFRRPDMIFNSQLWAEDGKIFLTQYFHYGWKSLFMTFAGYLHTIPRVVSIFGVKISELLGYGIILTPLLMNIMAISLSVSSIVYLLSSRFDWLTNIYFRVLIVFSIITLHNTFEIYGNITNTQWWLGYFLFLFSWDILYNNSLPTNILTIFIVSLVSLSTPLGIFPAISLILVYGKLIFKYNKTLRLKKILFTSPIILTSLIQIIFSFLNQTTSKIDFMKNIVRFFPVVYFNIISYTIIPNFKKLVNIIGFPSMMLFGQIIVVIIFIVNWKRKRLIIIPLSYFGFLLLFIYTGRSNFFKSFSIPFKGVSFNGLSGRFIFLPMAIIVTLIIISFANSLQIRKKILSVIFLICLLGIIYTNFNNFTLRAYKDFNWHKNVRNYNSSSSNYKKVKIPPGSSRWYCEIPIQTSGNNTKKQ